MTSVLEEDLELIATSEIIDWDKLDNCKILITGATGLIGSLIVKSMLLRNKLYNSNIFMYLPVRNEKKAIEKFGINSRIKYFETSVENLKKNIKIDYIIHGASPTKSKFFVQNPVETLDTSILGTKNVLEIAKKSSIKGMIYLSSMEMYGILNKSNVIEEDLGYIELLNLRSSYSEGKRIAELYCYSYSEEYNIPIKILRIAQTFGPGISKYENRVYKYFVDSILNNEDIILKSSGSTIINYSYTVDTVLRNIMCLTKWKNWRGI